MIPPIYQTLHSVSAIAALVGDRIFGSGSATEGETRPYIVWQIASAFPENNLSTTPEYDDQRIQIDCYAKSEVSSRQLAQLVRDAIEAKVNIVFGPWSDYESDTKLFRWSMDATWFLTR